MTLNRMKTINEIIVARAVAAITAHLNDISVAMAQQANEAADLQMRLRDMAAQSAQADKAGGAG